MTAQDQAIQRALSALNQETPAGEHPGHEVLEAYVEGRLTPGQRADVDRAVAQSQIVAEDLADLQAVHDALAHQPAARRNLRWGRVAAIAAVAASIVAAVAVGMSSLRTPQLAAVSHLASAEQQTVQRAIADGRITVAPPIESLIGKPGTLLGSPAAATSLRLLTPVGTLTRSPRPSFSWTDAGADAYMVAVFDQSFNEVLRSPRIEGTSWTAAEQLDRDKTFQWQVTAYRGTRTEVEPQPPRPEARFIVANATSAGDTELMMKRLDDEPLALGILLSERGFIDDSRAALQRASADPQTADIARRLLESLDQGTPITTKPAQ